MVEKARKSRAKAPEERNPEWHAHDGGPVGPGRPPSNPEAMALAREEAARIKNERRESNQRVEELAMNDPRRVVRELFAESAKAALEMYRRFNRSGRKEGVRDLIDASREARQLADRLLALIEAEGDTAEAEQFLATVLSRVEALAPELAELAQPMARRSA